MTTSTTERPTRSATSRPRGHDPKRVDSAGRRPPSTETPRRSH